MAEYISFPLDSNPDTLAQAAFDYIKIKEPAWLQNDANLETWIIRAIALEAAELTDVATSVTTAIFRTFGQLAGIAPVDAKTSLVHSTWTMIDNAGYTIPAGTTVGIPNAAGDFIPFQVVAPVVVPAGSTVTAAGAVLLVSLNPGLNTSGVGAVAGVITLIDPLDFVLSISQTELTYGGIDAETDDAYLIRLTTELQLLTPKPVLPRDFAILARKIANVYRAIAIDGYNPVGSTYNNEKMVTIVSMNSNGDPSDSPTKAAIIAYLNSLREVNFVVNTTDPTTTIIDVLFTATTLPGFSPVIVKAAGEQAIKDYLNPKVWGATPADPLSWDLNRTVVRLWELVTVLNNVTGLDVLSVLTMRTGAAAYAAADIALTGVAPLAKAGAVVGTVT